MGFGKQGNQYCEYEGQEEQEKTKQPEILVSKDELFMDSVDFFYIAAIRYCSACVVFLFCEGC